ncbi:U4/U6 small nuclear ribonucleoprotein [Phyllosticta citriasiana]|uniref:U4/U6 small nuclear ribonucleoprotein n=1 Tax=Phyllosticta citriasiana TaxID=595635 RepID=A0ABR1KDG1_9PEZI
MVEKRPYPENGDSQADSKRPRSSNASPAPPATGSSRPDISKAVAEARARAAAVRAKLEAQRNGGSASPSPAPPSAVASPPPAAPAQSAAEAARAKIDAMKARVARVAAATKKASTPTPPAPSWQPPQYEEDTSKARGGLNIGLHPALMGDSAQGAGSKGSKSMQPKFATTMANRRTESPGSKQNKKQLDLSGPSMEELKKNPYFDPNIGSAPTGRERKSKQLVFNQKGKFIQQANALRRQEHLEQMKKRIAEQAKKVGLDEDNEKAFLVSAPPEVEWWDEGLVDGAYDLEKAKIDTPDSIITHYIQHPVLLEPPQDKNAPAPKPLPLTSKEQAKLRRQRRMAEHKEQQAKIRLGLEPPPPPKVKKSNLMRVLGEQAVKDPTAVEARVNREIAERAAKHETENLERALTKEQRHEKLEQQQAGDAAKGITCCVFKVDSLAYGKHRYQVDINAKQNALTGVTVLHPKFNLVIVEGGAHSIKNYKKLMLHRIKWTENALPTSERQQEASARGGGDAEQQQPWLSATDDRGQLKDLSGNRCVLVWEGQEKQRAFPRWMGARTCETDTDAKDALTKAKMENMWTLAQTMQDEFAA